jgi:hypothetical protein
VAPGADSPHYTATRVLGLPACVDIGGESLRVEFLDLSRAAVGVIVRDARLGMLGYGDPDPDGEERRHQVTIATQRTFDLRDGRVINPRS